MSGDEIPFDVRALPAERKEDESEAAMPALPEGFDVQGVRLALMEELYQAVQETKLQRVRDEGKRRLHLDAIKARAYVIQVFGKLLYEHSLQDLEQRIATLEERHKEVPIC